MHEIIDNAGEHKPTLDDSDVARLIRAQRAKSSAQFNQLLKFHQSRGISTREVLAAMAASPLMIDALGSGRRR